MIVIDMLVVGQNYARPPPLYVFIWGWCVLCFTCIYDGFISLYSTLYYHYQLLLLLLLVLVVVAILGQRSVVVRTVLTLYVHSLAVSAYYDR